MSQLIELVDKAKSAINNAQDINAIEQIRVDFLGKKGHFTLQMASLRDVPADQRPMVGQKINDAKQEVVSALNEKRALLERALLDAKLANETIDVTLPGRKMEIGGLHPVSITKNRLIDLFGKLGFVVET